MTSRLKRARVVSGALLILVAAAGFLGGLAWQGGGMGSEPSEESDAGEDRGREGRRLVIDQVGLAPAKRAEVDEIIEHFTVRMRALDEEFRAAYEPIREGVRTAAERFVPRHQGLHQGRPASGGTGAVRLAPGGQVRQSRPGPRLVRRGAEGRRGRKETENADIVKHTFGICRAGPGMGGAGLAALVAACGRLRPGCPGRRPGNDPWPRLWKWHRSTVRSWLRARPT